MINLLYKFMRYSLTNRFIIHYRFLVKPVELNTVLFSLQLNSTGFLENKHTHVKMSKVCILLILSKKYLFFR